MRRLGQPLTVRLRARIVRTAASAGAALALLTPCAGPAAADPFVPETPYAIHSMLALNNPAPFKQMMFAEAAAAGASEIRVDIDLSALYNPAISDAMWGDVDAYMALSERFHIRILANLPGDNDPALQTCGPGEIWPRCAVTNLAGYAVEIARLVQHTRGVIDDFEIVNEPDGRWAFTGTPQEYAAMLSTAYAAVHENDPAGRVVLGGIMEPYDAPWLAAAFATPGDNAAHAFDVANVHLRFPLAQLTAYLTAWRGFFATYGDQAKPLWVTETGYPSDPTYQADPSFRGSDPVSGEAKQAAFLGAALPAMLTAGAAKVFVTERDCSSFPGADATEGLLGGAVQDADMNAPAPVEKPAYAVFSALAHASLDAVERPVAPAPVPVARNVPDPARASRPAPSARQASAHRRAKRHKPHHRGHHRRRRRARPRRGSRVEMHPVGHRRRLRAAAHPELAENP